MTHDHTATAIRYPHRFLREETCACGARRVVTVLRSGMDDWRGKWRLSLWARVKGWCGW